MISTLITVLTIIEVIVCLLLVLIVMMQRPRQEGLGASFGEGVTNQMWGAQTTNVLQKGTVWLAIFLFILTLEIHAG
jgi:preprotein translocase subunit SecG